MNKVPNELWVQIFTYCPLDVKKIPLISKIFNRLYKNIKRDIMFSFLKTKYDRVCFTSLTSWIYEFHMHFFSFPSASLKINTCAHKYKSAKKYNKFVKNRMVKMLKNQWNICIKGDYTNANTIQLILQHSRKYRKLLSFHPRSMTNCLYPTLNRNDTKIAKVIIPYYSKDNLNIHSARTINQLLAYNMYSSDGIFEIIDALIKQGLDIQEYIPKLLDYSIDTSCVALFDSLFEDYSISNIVTDKVIINSTVKWRHHKIPCTKAIYISKKLITLQNASHFNINRIMLNSQNIIEIKFLIENGADIHYKNDIMFTKSIDNNRSDIVQLLLENGVDKYTNNKEPYNEFIIDKAMDIKQLYEEKCSGRFDKDQLITETNEEFVNIISNYNKMLAVLDPTHKPLVF